MIRFGARRGFSLTVSRSHVPSQHQRTAGLRLRPRAVLPRQETIRSFVRPRTRRFRSRSVTHRRRTQPVGDQARCVRCLGRFPGPSARDWRVHRDVASLGLPFRRGDLEVLFPAVASWYWDCWPCVDKHAFIGSVDRWFSLAAGYRLLCVPSYARPGQQNVDCA